MAGSGKAAFITTSGPYEWTVKLFGLTSALSSQYLLRFETCLIYFDAVIVYGRTIVEELNRLEEVFLSAGLKLKHSKCVLL